MHSNSIDLLESVMTTTPKSIDVILEEMFSFIEKRNRNIHFLFNTGSTIPTRSELSQYFRLNKMKYSRVIISLATGKPVKSHSGSGLTQVRYKRNYSKSREE